jgi:hypothetical protein
MRCPIPALVLCACVAACQIADGEPDFNPTTSGGDDVGPGDSSGDEAPVPENCPAPTAGPTMHPGNNVEADEVWTADGSPHLVPYDFTIHAQIVVEPCAVVQLGESLTLTLVEGGELIAEGEADRPIRFERLEEDRWTAIRLLGGTASFAYAVLDGGGRTGNTAADLTGALIVRGRSDATAPDGTLAVNHVEITDSESPGVRLDALGGFTADSDDLTITAGASHPISAAATGVGTIPAGDYTGNVDDQIVLTTANNERILADATMHDRGVPYLVGLPGQVADLRVQANPGGLATLTIEPGVELRFPSASVFTIDHAGGGSPATGALIALGTEDDPIVFTSASSDPAPGDWLGVYFGGTLAGDDRLDHVRVEYAGGASSSGSDSCPYPGESIPNAAIRIFGVPPDAFITNTTIVASASHGIDRGWRSNVVVDLLESNEFDVVGCRETWSKLEDGTCPDPVPCPRLLQGHGRDRRVDQDRSQAGRAGATRAARCAAWPRHVVRLGRPGP